MPNAAGRPRDRRADEAIFDATVAILTEKGYAGLRMERVADRAGISKHTLYLRHKSPASLVVNAIERLGLSSVGIPDTGSFEQDLFALVHGVRRLLTETPFGVILPNLAGLLTSNPELVAAARAWLDHRRRGLEIIFDRAKERGELSVDADTRLMFENCVSPLYFRYLITGDPLDDQFLSTVVERALQETNKLAEFV